MSKRSSSGFTLIELVVTVAIVAILAAIAIPAFGDQMRKGRRAEAISAMQDAQLRLERYRVDHSSYAGSGVTITSPASYDFAINAAAGTPSNYTITATPKGDQAYDKCGTMTITKTGATVTKAPSSCW